MEWLNYHHLLYFWMVAREGTVAKAGEKLSLAQPTISGQLRALEAAFDQKLFVRSGRHLVLTETGRLVYSYADEIFGIGKELQETLKGKRSTRHRARFMVGVAESLPKLVASSVLAPVWTLEEPMQVICREGAPDRLLADLALHELDAVLTDAPVPASSRVRVFNHLLGEASIGFFGVSRLAAQYRRRFPHSLDGAPVLLPAQNSDERRALDDWFETEQLHPDVRGECEDNALLKTFGQAGHGLFPAPTVIAREVCRQYNVVLVGIARAVVSRYYVISAERRVKHPAVVAITNAAHQLFA